MIKPIADAGDATNDETIGELPRSASCKDTARAMAPNGEYYSLSLHTICAEEDAPSRCMFRGTYLWIYGSIVEKVAMINVSSWEPAEKARNVQRCKTLGGRNT